MSSEMTVVALAVTAVLVAWASAAEPDAGKPAMSPTALKPDAKAAQAAEAAKHTVTIQSTRDGSPQKALFYVPPEARPGGKGALAPLLVTLHTWSNGFDQCVEYLPHAVERKWVMVAPDFRGRNDRPEACGSALAIQDVLDAVAYARAHARVDESRIYLVGVSGGGHMSLLMAAKAPQVWAGVSAWVPISDLAAWHAENVATNRGYAKSIEKACGGPPGPKTAAEYRARSSIFHLAAAKGLPIDLNAGIHDGHTGSVPISHTLRAFNLLAEVNGLKDRQLSAEQIAFMTDKEQPSPDLAGQGAKDSERKRSVLFRREAGPARVTLFDGGHEGETRAALSWLARQKKGAPPAHQPAAAPAPAGPAAR